MASSQFLRAFFASSMGTALSRLLGLARDAATSNLLGAGIQSDTFYVAFGIPSIFRRFVADEGLTGAMVPALAETRIEDGDQAASLLADRLFGALMIANTLLCVLGMIFAEQLVLMSAWSWRSEPETLALATKLTRFMFPFVAMVSFVSFFEGLLNERNHFFIPKVAPGLVSAGMVAAVLGLYNQFEQPAMVVATGVILGGIAHVLVCGPPIVSNWGRLLPKINLRDPRVLGVGRELLKVIAIGIFAQLNLFVLRQVATSLPQGSVSHYWNATRITDLAQGVVAVAIGSALLPTVARSVAAKDWDAFRDEFQGACRLAGFLLIPSAVTVACFALPITSLIFRHGEYTSADVSSTAMAVRFMVPFMLAVAGINIIKKVYFALGDRRTLLIVGAIGVALTGGLGFVLTRGALGIAGLTLGLSLSTCLQLALYVLVLKRRLGEHFALAELITPGLKMLACALPAAALGWLCHANGQWELGPFAMGNWLWFGGSLVTAALLYIALAYAIKLQEVVSVVTRLAGRFGR